MNISRRQFALALLALPGCASGARTRLAAPWDTGRIAVPGGHVLWRAFGHGPKPSLLMVHGGGGAAAGSKPFELLSGLGRERRLISWDQLDAGESDKPRNPDNWRLERFVEELDTVRRQLAPGPIHVLGGSWGSALLMEWLVTRKPSNIVSIIFVCPTLDLARADAARRLAQSQLSTAARAAFETARPDQPPTPALMAANEEYTKTFIARHAPPEMRGGPPDPDFVRAMSLDMRNWNRAPDLATLAPPVLLLRGEYDYITDADLRAYAALRPGSEVVTIPDAAHLAFADNPGATTRAIRDFLARAERGA